MFDNNDPSQLTGMIGEFLIAERENQRQFDHDRDHRTERHSSSRPRVVEQARANTSQRPPSDHEYDSDGIPEEMTPEERAQKLVKDVEKAKAHIFANTGKVNQNTADHIQVSNPMVHSMLVDDKYWVVGAHTEDTLHDKIIRGEYVDFGKLIPKDHITGEDKNRMELIYKNGRAYWVPAKQTVAINSFARWEQAFRVYSNIYTKEHPHRSSELIEYNHVMHTISMLYIWSNAYAYDKDFRMHMAKNPNHSWSIILKQAWSMRLNDRLPKGNDTAGGARFSRPGVGFQNGDKREKFNEPCHRFNRGKCNFGTGCHYKHHCSYCYIFGHGSVNCRKAIGDRNNAGASGKNMEKLEPHYSLAKMHTKPN